MEHHFVNTEATSIESGLSYFGRSVGNPLTVRESAKEETAVKARKQWLYGAGRSQQRS
jgi:hypothetical protein